MDDLLLTGQGMRAFYTRLGGKSRLAKRLVAMFPADYDRYIEPFFGAGWVFFEKDKTPNEVINDVDKDIYYVLKDIQRVSEDQLSRMTFIPSKSYFNELKQAKPKHYTDRLYRYLYLKWASFSGNMQTYNASQAATMGRRQKQLIKRLPGLKERLQGVVILNQDFLKVIRKYDKPGAFFYLDPPYLETATREYKSPTIDIEALASQLRSLKGKFLLSYNDHPEIRRMFSGFRINKITTEYMIGGERRPVVELLISNY